VVALAGVFQVYQVVTLSSFVLHPRGIDYLDSAGILADNFRVVVIGTPQGTSKDHAAPAIQPPRGLFLLHRPTADPENQFRPSQMPAGPWHGAAGGAQYLPAHGYFGRSRLIDRD
jgi:hypothetical protein